MECYQFDAIQDDSVTHKAAVEVVAKEINSWFFDRSEDHFVRLIALS